MKKQILISTDSPKKTRVSIPVQLQGGNPLFGYIWIDDVCYTIIKKRNITVKRTVLGR
jgi:hypothetical protein